MSRSCLSLGILERLSKILGDTSEGLTGSEITRFLQNCNILDVSPSDTKWKRLLSAFENDQRLNNYSDSIFIFLQRVMEPSRYDEERIFETRRKAINEVLSYVGIELLPNGKYGVIYASRTISEAQKRARNLRGKLEERNVHAAVLSSCPSELVNDNYFHAVFESCKVLFERIRTLSDISKDGTTLVQYVFNHPILIINTYKTQQEKDEQKGFESMLEGLCYMFRNPLSHRPKTDWPVNEQDALEILSIISYCHRRLDHAVRFNE